MNIFLKFPLATPDSAGKLSATRPVRLAPGQQDLAGLLDMLEHDLGLDRHTFTLVSRAGVKLTTLTDGASVQLAPLVLGGKGGFGSLLRAFGKQITMSTNKDACRDLTGRRMKHVNNEKRLKEFVAKQAEMAKEKEAKKREKGERRRRKLRQIETGGGAAHVFLDAKYEEGREKISQDLEEALGKGVKVKVVEAETKENVASRSSGSDEDDSRGKQSEPPVIVTKASFEVKKASGGDVATSKFKDWLGVGDLDVSSSESDVEDEKPAKKLKR